ncbi:MAG: hypothetical protein ACLRL0_11015 [Christensenellaceae bacterium]|jgi:hypothetical protein|nr:MAG: hypothetical protein DBY05_03620 [Clostridiales bacterium]PWM02067.1 MAG: hypothetical protein DBY05_03220 [Clostridiales bacterium]
MRNEREKNAEKIRKVRWTYQEGGFEGSLGVHRELFGYFNIALRWEMNGRLRMGIENRGYPEFNRPTEEYDGEKEAAEELEQYFGEIDGLLKEQLKDIKERAGTVYREYVKEEISKLKAEKTVTGAGK